MNIITITRYRKKIVVTQELKKLFELYPEWGKEFKKRNRIQDLK